MVVEEEDGEAEGGDDEEGDEGEVTDGDDAEEEDEEEEEDEDDEQEEAEVKRPNRVRSAARGKRKRESGSTARGGNAGQASSEEGSRSPFVCSSRLKYSQLTCLVSILCCFACLSLLEKGPHGHVTRLSLIAETG